MWHHLFSKCYYNSIPYCLSVICFSLQHYIFKISCIKVHGSGCYILLFIYSIIQRSHLFIYVLLFIGSQIALDGGNFYILRYGEVILAYT